MTKTQLAISENGKKINLILLPGQIKFGYKLLNIIKKSLMILVVFGANQIDNIQIAKKNQEEKR